MYILCNCCLQEHSAVKSQIKGEKRQSRGIVTPSGEKHGTKEKSTHTLWWCHLVKTMELKAKVDLPKRGASYH